jgi:rhodanese-related sulfurtransferase
MPKDIIRNDVQRLMANGAQLVEVLPSDEYEEAHLPEAINIPLKKLDGQSIQILNRACPYYLLSRFSMRLERTSRVAARKLGVYRSLLLCSR